MTNLLERIKEHRQALARRSMEVPEWGAPGQPLLIYAKPETLEDFGAIAAANDKGFAEAIFETIKRLAVDEEGKRILQGILFTEFKWAASGPVAMRVASFLREPVKVEEAEGNSPASPD